MSDIVDAAKIVEEMAGVLADRVSPLNRYLALRFLALCPEKTRSKL